MSTAESNSDVVNATTVKPDADVSSKKVSCSWETEDIDLLFNLTIFLHVYVRGSFVLTLQLGGCS